MKKKHVIWGSIGLVIVLIIAAIVFRPKPDPLAKYEFEPASVDDLTQTVSVTGTVVPASDVSLAFESGGRIGYIVGPVGTQVWQGMVLASLISADLASDLVKAQAAVTSAEASYAQQEAAVEAQYVKLAELEKGARPEEIQIKETELALAKEKLSQLQSTQTNLLLNAQLQAEDAINRLTDDFFDNDQSNAVDFRYQIGGSVSPDTLESQRVYIRNLLLDFNAQDIGFAKAQLLEIKAFLSLLSGAFDYVISYKDGSPVSSTTIETNKTSLKTALANVQTSIDTLTDRQNAIASQKLTIKQIEQELALKKAPPTAEQIAAQKAAIKQAEAFLLVQQASIEQAKAAVQSIQTQFAKKSIIAPFSGVISKQDAKVGEIVASSSPVLSLISASAFQIEANVAEVDIGLVEVGQTAAIEVDAYPEERFTARVIKIDPAETVVEGVSTYLVRLEFQQADERLKSGMTVDIDLVTDEKSSVLSIPVRAIVTREGKTFVRVKAGEGIEEREVKAGIRAGGRVEILSGLVEGEEVVVRETN